MVCVVSPNFAGSRNRATHTTSSLTVAKANKVNDVTAGVCPDNLDASKNHQTPAVGMFRKASVNTLRAKKTEASVPAVNLVGSKNNGAAAVPMPRLLRPYAALRKHSSDVVCSAAYSLLIVAVGGRLANGVRGGVGVPVDLAVSRNRRTPTSSRLVLAASLRDHLLRAFVDEGAGVYGDRRGSRRTES